MELVLDPRATQESRRCPFWFTGASREPQPYNRGIRHYSGSECRVQRPCRVDRVWDCGFKVSGLGHRLGCFTPAPPTVTQPKHLQT